MQGVISENFELFASGEKCDRSLREAPACSREASVPNNNQLRKLPKDSLYISERFSNVWIPSNVGKALTRHTHVGKHRQRSARRKRVKRTKQNESMGEPCDVSEDAPRRTAAPWLRQHHCNRAGHRPPGRNDPQQKSWMVSSTAGTNAHRKAAAVSAPRDRVLFGIERLGRDEPQHKILGKMRGLSHQEIRDPRIGQSEGAKQRMGHLHHGEAQRPAPSPGTSELPQMNSVKPKVSSNQGRLTLERNWRNRESTRITPPRFGARAWPRYHPR